MKQLTIEEKARRYDEAIQRANELNYVSDKDSLQRKTVEYIFPELAESEDEKIRNELLLDIPKVFPHDKAFKYITWLEKRADHAKFINSIQVGDKVTRNEDGMLVNLSQLNRVAKKDEKQCQTFTNKDVDDVFLKDMSDAKKEQDEQILAWEEDELTRNAIINTLIDLVEMYYSGYSNKSMKNRLINFLKSLKDRLQPKPKWSEEDRDLIEEIISHYRHLIAIGSLDSEHYKNYIIPKLKSILSQNH